MRERALRLDGAVPVGIATTVVVDTSGCLSLDWLYAGKRGADATNLTVEYWDGAWQVHDTWAGTGVDDAGFFLRQGTITDANAMRVDFELRLVSAAGGAAADDFYIDDFVLRCWSNY